MAVFDKKVEIFNARQMSIGNFDPTKPGCYDNVKTFPLDVKPKRAIFFRLSSDMPVSIAFANSGNSSVYHKEDVTQLDGGPIPTDANKEMGLLMGVYPGDKAKVDIEIWMERI